MNAFCLRAILLLSLGYAGLPAASLPESRKIDELLAQGWQKAGVKPNPAASDEVLVRRLYLDIVGRIPSIQETQTYLKSADPDKRSKLIDHLLGSTGHTSHMFNYWADVLRLSENVKGRLTAEAYEEWLKKQLHANTPYDHLVRDLLTTDGGVWDSGSIGFWQRDENKLDHLAYTVQVFLGTSIICAQCHDHPFDKWTQMDYYHMAAFTWGMDTRSKNFDFLSKSKKPQVDRQALKAMDKDDRKAYLAKIQQQQKAAEAQASREDIKKVKQAMQDVLKPLRYTSAAWEEGKLPALPHDYKYTNGKPGDKVEPKAMFGPEALVKEGQTTLQAFAAWMTSPENPRFTTVIANRMWKKAFGIGLIEPVDQMTDSTVASHPALMDYLTQLMIQKKYSLKDFLRVLYHTEAYQRTATRQEVPAGETYHFTGPILHRMSAEQIWDSLLTLTRGSMDDAVDDDNVRLHQYLDDLAMLLGTLREKGATGLIETARQNAERLDANRKKLAEMQKQLAEAKKSGQQTTLDVKAISREAQQLRRETERDFLIALVGEERAAELREGYKARQDAPKRPQIDPKLLASMTKEQRRDFLKKAKNAGGGKDGLTLTTRASEQPSPARAGTFLRTFGQSDRELIENASTDASVPQALALLNGPLLDALTSPVSKLSECLRGAATLDERLETVYEALLSRAPDAHEKAVLKQAAIERGEKAVGDVIHALITGAQFLFVQ